MVNLNVFVGIAIVASTVAAAPTTRHNNTTYLAPVGEGNFQLMALAYAGDLSLSGMFITEFAVDHFEDAILTAQPLQPAPLFCIAPAFNTTAGEIYSGEGNYYRPWGLQALVFSSSSFLGYWHEIPNYDVIGFAPDSRLNSTQLSNGFTFRQKNNILDPRSYAGMTLAVCPWIPVYDDPAVASKQYGLMARQTHIPRNQSCADVHLKAVFLNGTFPN